MNFYVNGDDGYYWLTCDDCEEPVMEIEAGTYLDAASEAARAHVCEKRSPTPAKENR